MVPCTLQSNVADVLSLGPRTAGRLMQVGVRTVQELLDASPQATAKRIADRRLSAVAIVAWQNEARLLVTVEGLSWEAAQILVAAGFTRAERIARGSPTAVLAAIEAIWSEESATNRFSATLQPAFADVSGWIAKARQAAEKRAA